ncbi:PHB depolymerase family esterase [Sphingomonas sabuli]|uniref:PHB depolymerase family esterase n=1 Tax=Sphingomonas sabuli TaxID=2764186 RepID=A0A7G9L377_9SPHN|nr:PHB depolymerase family esterase [Sphingomonas sabuli]QNM83076.1 PHB depolymerase family esterase [Sphingomonas sabuli]
MPSISTTIDRLKRMKLPLANGHALPGSGRLTHLDDFGSNPGNLTGLVHVPDALPARSPLVVVLHGCTQNAASYDSGSGWSALADEFGFAVLFPEQQRTNNASLCFNWFTPEDTRRGGGEPQSIRQMVAAMVERHDIDPQRVFVTGLSAGGAMTSVMLATYPDVFAGGAIIAGLPYGVASGVPQALERMRGHGHDEAALGKQVRRASSHKGPWPTVAVWHGTADSTVDQLNGALSVAQWADVHGVGDPASETRDGSETHRTWANAKGKVVLEEHVIDGLGHGTPIAAAGPEASGTPGPYMLEAGISSTYRIAASWGIVPATAPARRKPALAARPARPEPAVAAPLAARQRGPAAVINEALRSAGLMPR